MFKKNLLANYLGQGWTSLMNFAFVPIYISYLGVESYGLIGVFAIVQVWLSLLDLGISPSLAREMARLSINEENVKNIRDLLRTIEIIMICLAITVVFILKLSSSWLSTNWLKTEYIQTNIVGDSFFLMGIIFALRFVESIYRSSLSGMQQQVLLNAISAFMATTKALGSIILLKYVSADIIIFFEWQIITSIITLIIFCISTYKLLPIMGNFKATFSLDSLKKIGKFAGGISIITFLSMLLTQVDKLLLSKLLTLTDFGYYTIASTVSSSIYILVGPITTACFPRLSNQFAQKDYDGLAITYHKASQLVSVLAGSATIVILTNCQNLISLWTQNPILANHITPIVIFMLIGNLLNCLLWVPYQVQLAHGWTSFAIWTNVVAVLVVIPSIIVITPKFGAVGAACIWMFLNLGYFLISIHFMHRKILKYEKWNWYFFDVLKPLIVALITCEIINWLLPESKDSIIYLLEIIAISIITLLMAGLSAKHVKDEIVSTFYKLNFFTINH